MSGEKLYYIPAYNIGTETNFINGNNLGCVDLTTKEVTVMEEAAYDMPRYSPVPESSAHLTSNFLVGSCGNSLGNSSFVVIYDFETGDIMYISKSSMFGKVPLPE